MIKVIQFLILGVAILHFSEAQSAVDAKLVKFVKADMTLSEFVDTVEEIEGKKLTLKKKVSAIKAFNQIDQNGDLEIDSYEYITMN